MNSGSNMGTQGLQLPNKALLLEGFLDGQTEAIRRSGPAIACVFPAKFVVVSLVVTAVTLFCMWLMHFERAAGTARFWVVAASGLGITSLVSWIVSARALLLYQRAEGERTGALLRERDSLLQEHDLLCTIVDHLPDQIYAKDRLGRFILNNAVHAKSLGLESSRDMAGKTDFDFFPEHLATQFFADEQALIASNLPILNQEQFIPQYGKPGVNYWVSASKVLWRNSRGEILGTVGITRDIHASRMAAEALRRSEEKLRESTLQLERSNRELQDFAYVASHDLQEPLRKIVVFGERLKEKCSGALSSEAGDYLERMERAARRMQTLINDLLSFSRVTIKAQALTTVDVAKTAREVVGDLEARIETVHGRVELGPLPVLQAEPLQMRQLLQNLIGNALKFHRPEEPPVVKVEAKMVSGPRPGKGRDAPAEERWELAVSDNGIGFDEKYLDRIFNVFQRLHTRNEYEGSGMGLAIARKIAVFHGGDITARSRPGHGSTFIVTLPVAHPQEANHE